MNETTRTERPHILYIHQYFATPRGKTGTRSYEFARRWVDAGCDVTMLTSVAQLAEAELKGVAGKRIKRFAIDGINVVALDVPYHQTMSKLRRIGSFVHFMILASWMALRIPKVDMIFATSTPLTIGIPALVARWFRGRRYVFEVRDVWPAVPVGMGLLRNRLLIFVLEWFEWLTYRNAHAVIALSSGMAESVNRRCEKVHVEVATNCSDTEFFHPHVNGQAVRDEHGWGDDMVCSHCGAMGKVNGLDLFVRLAEHFQEKGVRFLLVGEGDQKEMLLRKKTEKNLDNLDIWGSLPKERLPEIFAASDVAMVTISPIPILEWNSANKFFDGLSAGKPVVINYGGWQREVLEESDAGYGCDQGDEADLIVKLQKLKDDPSLRKEMGKNARKLAETRYSRDLIAAKVLDVIMIHRKH